MKLHIFDSLPENFLEVDTHELADILPGPSLIRLPGELNQPLFVATLLHGDEITGFLSAQKVLKHYLEKKQLLPRRLLLFVGNVEAARINTRRLQGQPDYNRIWSGGPLPENRLAQQLLELAKEERPLACVDIHNSSGRNPHYSALNRLDDSFINLGRLFSQTLVYFTRPGSVLSNAFSEFCPSITIEGGQPGDLFGIQHTCEFLDKCLNLTSLDDSVDGKNDYNLYRTLARIQVPEQSRIGFDKECGETDFCFLENLDLLNFKELPEDSLLGWRSNPDMRLSVVDEQGQSVEDTFIHYKDNEIRLRRPVVPSLFTTNEKSVHQDCLGYLMEKYTR